MRNSSAYTVIMRHAVEGGYWVEVPALPGCLSQGDSLDEALINIQDAISSHIEALKEDGQDVPEDGQFILARVAVAS